MPNPNEQSVPSDAATPPPSHDAANDGSGSSGVSTASGAGDASGVAKSARKRWIKRLIKWTLVVVVLIALGRQVEGLIADWREQDKALSNLTWRPAWLVAAWFCFIAGQVFFALFWGRLLRHIDVKPGTFEVVRAYGIGTVGKYVPGKALVVVLRAAMLRVTEVTRVSLGLSVVFETVTMMAVGAAVAAVCLAVTRPEEWLYWLGAAGIAIGLSGALHPQVFGRLAKFAAMPFKDVEVRVAPGEWFTTYLRWMIWPILAWTMLGASFWATIQGMGLSAGGWSGALQLTGVAALATALGFLVLFMPAGFGVRELVIIHLLGPTLGSAENGSPEIVVLASLLLRSLWTTGEIGFSGLLYAVGWRGPRAAAAATDLDPPAIAPGGDDAAPDDRT
jgi:hypothetical protein